MIPVRIALKVAYDGTAFYGHQRQPEARTVEGEAIIALRAARIIRDPQEAWFRSASRTDRGVSAVGNVIAFNTTFPPKAVVGAFNDRARDVWAWAFAVVPDDFHPRRAEERWYRYHLFEDLSLARLRAAAQAFAGTHDLSSFTREAMTGPFTIRHADVTRDEEATLVDLRAHSFRRGMVRRIVAAVRAHARGEIGLDEIEESLRGRRRDFGMEPPEPLVLMDIRYETPFTPLLPRKVRADWRAIKVRTALRGRWIRSLEDAARRTTPGTAG